MDVLGQVQQALVELGLPRPASLTSGLDQTATQCLGLWNALGQELYEQYRWKELVGTHTFETVEDQASYALPTDWAGPIDQTEWDRTNHWPLLGQKTPQEWQWLKSGIISMGPRLRYRYVDNSSIELFPTPGVDGTGMSEGEFTPWTMSVMYYRDGWVSKANGTTATIATLDTDRTFFNERMMINGTKLKLWAIKGFDTRVLQADFERSFNQAMARNQGAPRLSLSPRPTNYYLGPWSVQDGSWPIGNG
jgi:hypothetical protein